MNQRTKIVDYQLPNIFNDVNFLLNDIKCKDTGLNIDIKMLKGDKGPTGKMNTLEYAALYLTP